MELKELEERTARALGHARVGNLIHATLEQAVRAHSAGDAADCERLVRVAEELQEDLELELREAVAPPALEQERPTNTPPAPPADFATFETQLAERGPLPELDELEPYEPRLPELSTLVYGDSLATPLITSEEIGSAGDGKSGTEDIGGETLKPEALELKELRERGNTAEVQQGDEPITKKDPAETASGEPPETA